MNEWNPELIHLKIVELLIDVLPENTTIKEIVPLADEISSLIADVWDDKSINYIKLDELGKDIREKIEKKINEYAKYKEEYL